MQRRAGIVLAVLLCLGLSQLALAQFPAPQGHVNDFAKVLDQRSRAELEVVAEELEREQGIELAVVTIETTAPYDPAEYRTRLFEEWGIGGPEDSGLLIVLSLEERAIEVETGYGLEGTLPDGKVGAYLDQAVSRYFAQGEYGPGLSYLAQAFQKELAGEVFEQAEEQRRAKPSGDWLIAFGIFLLIVVLMRRGRNYPPGGMGGGGSGPRRSTVFVPTMRFPGSRGGFGSSRGGGFGGFGGGRSGGGGASRRF